MRSASLRAFGSVVRSGRLLAGLAMIGVGVLWHVRLIQSVRAQGWGQTFFGNVGRVEFVLDWLALLLSEFVLLGLLRAVWRLGRQLYKRAAFAAGKSCVACARSLDVARLCHPMIDEGPPMRNWWVNPCACGELTLFGPDGSAQRIEDRSRE